MQITPTSIRTTADPAASAMPPLTVSVGGFAAAFMAEIGGDDRDPTGRRLVAGDPDGPGDAVNAPASQLAPAATAPMPQASPQGDTRAQRAMEPEGAIPAVVPLQPGAPDRLREPQRAAAPGLQPRTWSKEPRAADDVPAMARHGHRDATVHMDYPGHDPRHAAATASAQARPAREAPPLPLMPSPPRHGAAPHHAAEDAPTGSDAPTPMGARIGQSGDQRVPNGTVPRPDAEPAAADRPPPATGRPAHAGEPEPSAGDGVRRPNQDGTAVRQPEARPFLDAMPVAGSPAIRSGIAHTGLAADAISQAGTLGSLPAARPRSAPSRVDADHAAMAGAATEPTQRDAAPVASTLRPPVAQHFERGVTVSDAPPDVRPDGKDGDVEGDRNVLGGSGLPETLAGMVQAGSATVDHRRTASDFAGTDRPAAVQPGRTAHGIWPANPATGDRSPKPAMPVPHGTTHAPHQKAEPRGLRPDSERNAAIPAGSYGADHGMPNANAPQGDNIPGQLGPEAAFTAPRRIAKATAAAAARLTVYDEAEGRAQPTPVLPSDAQAAQRAVGPGAALPLAPEQSPVTIAQPERPTALGPPADLALDILPEATPFDRQYAHPVEDARRPSFSVIAGDGPWMPGAMRWLDPRPMSQGEVIAMLPQPAGVTIRPTPPAAVDLADREAPAAPVLQVTGGLVAPGLLQPSMPVSPGSETWQGGAATVDRPPDQRRDPAPAADLPRSDVLRAAGSADPPDDEQPLPGPDETVRSDDGKGARAPVDTVEAPTGNRSAALAERMIPEGRSDAPVAAIARDIVAVLRPEGTPTTPVVPPHAPEPTVAETQASRAVAPSPAETILRATAPDRLDLSLDSPELGRIRCAISLDEGGVHLALVAERAETMDFLRRNAGMLAMELRDSGLGSASFSFAGDHAGERGKPPALRSTVAAAPVITETTARMDGARALDLRL